MAMPGPTAALLPALLSLVGGGLLGLLVARLVQRVLGRITRRTASTTDDFVVTVLVDTIPPVAWVLSASLAWQILPTDAASDRLVYGLAKLILVVLIVRLVNRIGLRLLQRWANRAGDLQVANLIRSLAPMLKALVWCLGAVFYLQNIGVQMAAIWALLSAGGISAGLALKEPVSQFFEYITILLDKPFQPGQLIHVGQVWGTVEKVGVRSTRLRSINGEAIVMSNSSLTGAVVANFGEMQRRRLTVRLKGRTGRLDLVDNFFLRNPRVAIEIELWLLDIEAACTRAIAADLRSYRSPLNPLNGPSSLIRFLGVSPPPWLEYCFDGACWSLLAAIAWLLAAGLPTP